MADLLLPCFCGAYLHPPEGDEQRYCERCGRVYVRDGAESAKCIMRLITPEGARRRRDEIKPPAREGVDRR